MCTVRHKQLHAFGLQHFKKQRSATVCPSCPTETPRFLHDSNRLPCLPCTFRQAQCCLGRVRASPSTCPKRQETERGVSSSPFFSPTSLPGRSYNVSLPTATQVSRPETRCYLGYRYPCTRRGRQGASCAFLLLALDDQPVATPIRTARRTAGAVADRARSSKLPDVRPVPRVPAPAAPESLTQFVNLSAPKSTRHPRGE